MSVLRTNVDFAKKIFFDRLGNPYVYGGCWNPHDTSVGTDCSGLVVAILDAVVNGPNMKWSRHGMSTESWRPVEVGERGPFGTITVANWHDFPPDAAVKVALHHGPGGGAASHMVCEVDGVAMESSGSDGCVTQPRAMRVTDPYFNDWAYLPGPVVTSQHQPVSKSDGYALAIIGEGRRRGVTPRGIQIALATALVESNLRMYANASVPESMNLPHDAVGFDHDSVGLFQQRCPMWGPAYVLMDPAKSAGLFYDHLVRLDYNNPARPPGDFAADVQRPAAQYRGRYQERMGDAVNLYNRLAGAPPADWDDFMSALSPQEQRALYDAVMAPRQSRSPLRHIGESTVGDMPDQIWDTDGSVHVLIVYLCAVILGDPDAIALLREVASARDPNRLHDSRLAQAMLNLIDGRVTVQSAPPTGVTPGVIPNPVPVAPIPTPPTPPVYIPPTPVAPAPADTGDVIAALYRALDHLRLADSLPIESRAPLAALVSILNTKNGASV